MRTAQSKDPPYVSWLHIATGIPGTTLAGAFAVAVAFSVSSSSATISPQHLPPKSTHGLGWSDMWPKLIAQLFELLPHITRLVPMADRYFSTRTASEKATEAAMVAMAEGVRGDLGQVIKAHAGLYRQLQDQNAVIAQLSEDVKRARLSIEQDGHRFQALESTVTALSLWIKIGVSLLTLLAVIILVVLIQLLHAH